VDDHLGLLLGVHPARHPDAGLILLDHVARRAETTRCDAYS
jgi:hypothetical protein